MALRVELGVGDVGGALVEGVGLLEVGGVLLLLGVGVAVVAPDGVQPAVRDAITPIATSVAQARIVIIRLLDFPMAPFLVPLATRVPESCPRIRCR